MIGDYMPQESVQKNFLRKINAMENSIQHNMEQTIVAANKICEQNDKWREASGCTAPYQLQRKINRLENEIREWQQISGCKTPKTLDNQLNKLGVNTKQILTDKIQEQRFDIYSKYIYWLENVSFAFVYQETYMRVFEAFQSAKQDIINIFNNGGNLSRYNYWYIVDFLLYLAENNIRDPDVDVQLIAETKNQINTKKTEFDIYDKNKKWLHQQAEDIQILINKEMN